MLDFDAKDWYWRFNDGSVYSSARQMDIDAGAVTQDADYQAFLSAGGVPVQFSPDKPDTESRASLKETLKYYKLRMYPPGLEEARADRIAAIDAETSAAIIAGFDYDINGETLHFSYDANDQQNFADTGNAATLATLGVPGVPRSVIWNGWKVEKDADDAVLSRSLVRLTLSVNDFLALYMAGALAHKAACMERGGMRKAAVEAAQTLEELQAVLGER